MKQENYHITQYCSIKAGELKLNGEVLFSDKGASPAVFFKQLYQHLNMKYPKFHKMDMLCKLAVLCFEQMHQKQPITEKYAADKIALVICNKHASLDTDWQHQKSISNPEAYFPSPAVFVYTLANIMLGEIAIRHKIKGENACLVQEEFNTDQFVDYCNMLFAKGETECIIGGWVDFFENDYSTHLLCIEKDKLGLLAPAFKKDTLNKIFTIRKHG